MIKPIRLAIAGGGGRMGRTLIEAVLTAPDAKLAAVLETQGNPLIGRDAGELIGLSCGMTVSGDRATALDKQSVDCLIDFTRPQGTLAHLAVCRQQGIRMVIGTTGFSAEQKEAIAAAAQDIAIVMAPNMAVGVNAVFKLLDMAARILADYDVEIIEAHHRHKVDAPSGTALRMGEVVAAALGRSLFDNAVHGRHGHSGERPLAQIGFSAIRGGDIVGDHTVLFAGAGERIEITHKAASRMPYAQGSLLAARFLMTQSHGLFDMQDVLGLR